MFHQELEALAVAVGVVRWRVGAIDFFRGMEDFEGEDGEAIDREAGALGSAGPIFNVPKVEVGTVLGCDCVVERLPGNDDVERVIVPQAGGAVVKSGDFGSRKVEKFAHPGFEAMVEHQ